jgi:beta-lactamase regulating signal transducer with metallopeptidase domain/uncharacterized GH25 family protein
MSNIAWWAASWLLDVSIKAALLALAAWVGMAACRVRSSTVRHRVWFLALVGMLLLPALVNVLPGVPLPGWLYPALPRASAADETDGKMPPPSAIAQQPAADKPTMPGATLTDSASPTREMEPAGQERDRATHDMAGQGPRGQGPREVVAGPLPPPARDASYVAPRAAGPSGFALAVMVVYLAGAVLLTLRLLVGLIHASKLVRRAKHVDLAGTADRLPDRARIVESAEVLVPVTIGYRRPAVVLPADWKTWSDASLAMVLAHETEHVRRGDTWVALLAAWNCVVYWFHPAAWLVRRRLAGLAELECDDAVIRVTGSRNEYAQNLLEMAGRLTCSGRLRPVGVAMARTPNVVQRIEAILDNDRPLSRKIGAATALLLACIVAPVVFLAAGLRPAAPSDAAERAPAAVEGTKTAAAKTTGAKTPAAGLKGRVVMADGKPVAGAEVRLLTWSPRAYAYHTTTTATNAEGQFEFKELTEGRYKLAAYYQKSTSRSKLYQGYEAKAGEESIVLRLHEAPSLKVKVVARADGKPIPGATVRLVWADVKPDHLTDADGEVLINGLTCEDWTIEARAKGFAVDSQAVKLSGTETASVTAKLDPGVELFGVVRDEAGKGLPDVAIAALRSGPPSSVIGGQIDYVKTDADGKYRFEYLPIGGLKLGLSKEGYLDLGPDVAMIAAPGGRQELNLTLARRPDGGSVRGTVVDKDGKPVAGASVVNGGRSTRKVRETTTDAQGRFRLDDVFTEPRRSLSITAKRFAPQQLEFKPGDREHPAELNVTLAAGHRIHGRVVDEQGQPLAGVLVYTHDNGSAGRNFGNSTTDAEGRFEFDSLTAVCPFTLSKNGYSDMDYVTLPLDGQKEVTVAMHSAGVIRGRVVDDRTGKPLSPFKVRVTFSPDPTPNPTPGVPTVRLLSGARVIGGEVFATRDGTFRLDDFVRDMPLQVTVEAEGYDRAVMRRVVAVADREAKPVEFRLAPIDASSLLTIAGRLVDEQAKPLVGAELRLIVASKRPFPRDRSPFGWEMIRSGRVESNGLVLQFLKATTDREGRFRFTQVRAGGDIELAYWGEGVSQDRREHIEQLSPKEQNDLTVTSKTPGVVRGAIDKNVFPEVSSITLSGKGFSDAKVSLRNNSYEIRNVPPGLYWLQVYGPDNPSGRGNGLTGGVLKRIPVEVKSGETLTVDLGPDWPFPAGPRR